MIVSTSVMPHSRVIVVKVSFILVMSIRLGLSTWPAQNAESAGTDICRFLLCPLFTSITPLPMIKWDYIFAVHRFLCASGWVCETALPRPPAVQTYSPPPGGRVHTLYLPIYKILIPFDLRIHLSGVHGCGHAGAGGVGGELAVHPGGQRRGVVAEAGRVRQALHAPVCAVRVVHRRRRRVTVHRCASVVRYIIVILQDKGRSFVTTEVHTLTHRHL